MPGQLDRARVGDVDGGSLARNLRNAAVWEDSTQRLGQSCSWPLLDSGASLVMLEVSELDVDAAGPSGGEPGRVQRALRATPLRELAAGPGHTGCPRHSGR